MNYSKDQMSRIFSRYFIKPFCVSAASDGEPDKREIFNTSSRYIFRGIDNAAFEIISGAAIRLNNNSRDGNSYRQYDFINYHLNLIEQRRHLLPNSKESLHDLEHLAEIEHHGGATCLIDFTYNYLLALFFATESSERGAKSGKCRDSDGAVFCIDLDDDRNEKIVPLRKGWADRSIEAILTKRDRFNGKSQPRIWLWKPAHLNSRIVKQDSVFLFSLAKAVNDVNLVYKKIIVKAEHKRMIRELLRKIFSISDNTVYDDLQGFSNIFNHKFKKVDNSLLKHGATCVSYARKLYGDENYSSSLTFLDAAIECIKYKLQGCELNCSAAQLPDVYFYKGLNLERQHKFTQALNCYLEAKQHKNGVIDNKLNDIIYQIINSYFDLEQHDSAFDFVKEVINEHNSSDSNLHFSFLELAIICGKLNEFLCIYEGLVRRYRTTTFANILLLLHSYALIGFSLIISKSIGKSDRAHRTLFGGSIGTVSELLSAIQEDEHLVKEVRVLEKLNKKYKAELLNALFSVTDLSQEGSCYCHELNWEFDSISRHVAEQDINPQLKIFLSKLISRTEDQSNYYFTKYVLSAEAF